MSTCQCPAAVAAAVTHSAPGSVQPPAGQAATPAPLVISGEVQRDAMAAVVEMSALADTMRRLDQSGPDAIAMQLMVSRINALSEALCWVLEGGSTAAEAELRKAVKLTAGGVA